MQNDAGHVLITQRKPDGHLPLLWEFPGGKVEPGESDVEALVRELREELALEAAVGEELARVVHTYERGGEPFEIELILLAASADFSTMRAVDVHDMRFVPLSWFDENLSLLPPADAPLVAQCLARLSRDS